MFRRLEHKSGHKVDTTSTSRHRLLKSKDLNILIREAGLFDVWGSVHSRDKEFTHQSATHKVHSRLDFFLMNAIDRQQIYLIIILCI